MCVRSAMLYANETWALRIEDLRRLERNEHRMLRWIAGIALKDQKTNDEVPQLFKLQPIQETIRRNRLRWFGHVKRKKPEDGVKKEHDLVVDGKRSKGRPRKTWDEVIKTDMKSRGLTCDMAQNRAAWKAAIRFKMSNP